MQRKQLYGGAIEALVPSNFLDVSDIRQIPDHQEFFADLKNTQEAIIFELNLYDPNISDKESAKHHFEELAKCNEAISFSIDNVKELSDEDVPNFKGLYKCLLSGKQTLPRKGEIYMLFAVIRIPKVSTDICIQLNVPGKKIENEGVKHFMEVVKSFVIKDWNLFK